MVNSSDYFFKFLKFEEIYLKYYIFKLIIFLN